MRLKWPERNPVGKMLKEEIRESLLDQLCTETIENRRLVHEVLTAALNHKPRRWYQFQVSGAPTHGCNRSNVGSKRLHCQTAL